MATPRHPTNSGITLPWTAPCHTRVGTMATPCGRRGWTIYGETTATPGGLNDKSIYGDTTATPCGRRGWTIYGETTATPCDQRDLTMGEPTTTEYTVPWSDGDPDDSHRPPPSGSPPGWYEVNSPWGIFDPIDRMGCVDRKMRNSDFVKIPIPYFLRFFLECPDSYFCPLFDSRNPPGRVEVRPRVGQSDGLGEPSLSAWCICGRTPRDGRVPL